MSVFDNTEIIYPAQWYGRAIVHAEQADVAGERLHQTLLAFGVSDPPVRGETSRNGTYVTFAVQALIRDAAMLASLPKALAEIEGVRMLL